MTSKIKFFLTIVTILIAVTPITVQVVIHRDNLVGLILPPTVEGLLSGSTIDFANADFVDYAGMSFPLPYLSKTSLLTRDNNIKMIYTFTNPLDGKITIASIEAEIICTDHAFPLGNVFIEPVTFEAHQTLDLELTCILSSQGIEHIKTHHDGQNSINTEFKNYSIDLTDIKIIMDHRKLGNIQIPQTIYDPTP